MTTVRLMAVLYIELLPEAEFYSKERVLKEISEELKQTDLLHPSEKF